MISVYTEISDATHKPRRGSIFFDGACPFCLAWVRRTRRVFEPRGFAFVPLQTTWVRAHFHLPENELLREMRVMLRTGETYAGADAIITLAKYVWWAWPLVALAHVPGVRPLLCAVYRHIAARRHCLDGSCAIPSVSGFQSNHSRPEEEI